MSKLGNLLATTSMVACCSMAQAAEQPKPTSFEIYGFAMADVIFDTDRVDPAWVDAFRPSKIATFDGEFGENGQSSVSVKQSRLGFKGTIPVADDSDPINFKAEIDFFGVGVDEGQTTIRLRHFYGEWGFILGGQTHSLFMDIDVFPNVIDYWGPCGMVFLRTPQVRWTVYRDDNIEFAVAVEKPGNDIDPGLLREIDPSLENVFGSEEFPDVTSHLRFQGDWGHFQIAGILRQVGFDTFNPPTSEPTGNRTGWGVALSGRANLFERDKLMGSVVFGQGIASYMNDGGTDLAAGGSFLDPHAEAVPLLGLEIYLDHYWDEQWSTSIGYSSTQVDNTTLQAPDAFRRGDYASVNLLYAPTPELLFGGELMWGKRTDKDNFTDEEDRFFGEGEDVRFQFSAKYLFGIQLAEQTPARK